MFTFQTQIRESCEETDKIGYVYYGNYATYYEVARVEALRSLGLTYKSLEDQGILMPVIEYNTKYIKPALYDDVLTIQVKIKKIPGIRITFEYEIFNESEKLINLGMTTLTFINTKTNRVCEAPEAILNVLKPLIPDAKSH